MDFLSAPSRLRMPDMNECLSSTPTPGRGHRPLLVSVLGLLAACSGSDTTSPTDADGDAGPVPARLEAVSGDAQSGEVASTLGEPLVVEVEDAAGTPLAGVAVSWSVVTGGGTLSPSSSFTDGRGRARVTWTLGTAAGPQRARARVGGLPEVAFSAEALPGPPSGARMVSGDGQSGLVGTLLPEVLTVEVVDAYGNPVPDIPVEWSASGGSLREPEERTDEGGAARASWVLPSETGSYTVEARSGDASAVFRAEALSFGLACTPGEIELSREGSTSVLCFLGREGSIRVRGSLEVVETDLPPSVTLRMESRELETSDSGRVASLLRLTAVGAGSEGAGSVRLEAVADGGARATSNLEVRLVHQRPRVRLVYLVPSDRDPHAGFARVVERIGQHFRGWLEDELGGGESFTLAGVSVEVLETAHEADWYAATSSGRDEFLWFWDNVVGDGLSLTGGEVGGDRLWVFLIDAQHRCGQIGGAAVEGLVVLEMENQIRSLDGIEPRQKCPEEDRSPGPQARWIGGFGHELGHAMGVPHPPGCDEGESSCDHGALMWLGFRDYPDTYLRADEKPVLEASGFVRSVTLPDELFDPVDLSAESVTLPPAGGSGLLVGATGRAAASRPELSCFHPGYPALRERPLPRSRPSR